MATSDSIPLPWRTWLIDEQTALQHADRFRQLRQVQSCQGPEISLGGRPCLHFCSNDYLSLAGSQWLRRVVADATNTWGSGGGASRLVSGNQEPHEQLEQLASQWLGSETALLFGSGWHANTGIPGALGSDVTFFSDQLNHASLIDGMRLARGKIHVFPHADVDALRKALHASSSKRKVIVSDAVFSMDGDLAPVKELAALANEYDALLYLDEAHALGIVGDKGAGLGSILKQAPAIRMGTLGKALGLFGSFAAVPALLRNQLVNRARSQIFATALPPAIAVAACHAIRWVIDNMPAIGQYRKRAAIMADSLRALGLNIPETSTPIIPVMVGHDSDTMKMCARLLELGIFIQGIRPPTVPEGSARLRLTIQLGHSPEHLERLLDAFARL